MKARLIAALRGAWGWLVIAVGILIGVFALGARAGAGSKRAPAAAPPPTQDQVAEDVAEEQAEDAAAAAALEETHAAIDRAADAAVRAPAPTTDDVARAHAHLEELRRRREGKG